MRKDTLRFMKTAIDTLCKKEKRIKLFLYIGVFYNFIFYGFTPRQYFGLKIYKKKHREKRKYVNFWRAKKLEKIYNNSSKKEFFNNKVLFNQTFSKFVHRKWIYMKSTNKIEIKKFCESTICDSFIVKPINLSSGYNIFSIHKNEISKYIGQDYLIEEKVVNHKNIAKLSDKSCNTVRIFTLIKNNKLNILSASLRIGSHGSVIDNMHGNGHAVPIDICTGIVCGIGKNYLGETFVTNPNCGQYYIGMKIPFWEQVLSSLEEVTKIIPEIKYNGWDIAITECGIEYIEGNVMPDPNFMQLFLEDGNYYKFK